MSSAAVEDYLKAIYRLQTEEGQVTTTGLAAALHISPASATNMVKKLASMKLVRHSPYRGVELTASGEKTALQVIRHHRLLELYLNSELGLPWDQVHAEAEKIEHVLSPELEDRIADKLGNPAVDPHGDPIPTPEGTVARSSVRRLSEVPAGTHAIIRRVGSQAPEHLR